MQRLAPTLACVAALLASGCGGDDSEPAASPPPAPPPPAAEPVAAARDGDLFAVDPAAPLACRDAGMVDRANPVKIHDGSFADGRGGRVQAFRVVPPGAPRKPGVLYVHGAGGSRVDLLAPATWLAGRGAVALVVDLPGLGAAAEGGSDAVEAVELERDRAAADVARLRRALDVLAARADVDPRRLGYVGVSSGARLGAVLAGVDDRLKALALVSGGAAPVDEYAAAAPVGDRDAVRRLLSSVDPLRLLAGARPAALLFQGGLRDEVVPADDLRRFAAAGSQPKDVRWYPSGHWPSTRMFREQLDWLEQLLAIEGPPVPGALTGPGR